MMVGGRLPGKARVFRHHLACRAGLSEAVLLERIYVRQALMAGPVERRGDGRWYVHMPMRALSRDLPYFHARTIRRLVKTLRAAGLLHVDVSKGTGQNAGAWYSVDVAAVERESGSRGGASPPAGQGPPGACGGPPCTCHARRRTISDDDRDAWADVIRKITRLAGLRAEGGEEIAPPSSPDDGWRAFGSLRARVRAFEAAAGIPIGDDVGASRVAGEMIRELMARHGRELARRAASPEGDGPRDDGRGGGPGGTHGGTNGPTPD
jgi:hypothetical protein